MATPPQAPPPPRAGFPQDQGTPGIAVAGFVCSLVGLLISWIGWGLLLCIIGIVLSIMGRRQAAERGAPSGLATAGLVMGIVGSVIAVAIIIFVIILADEVNDSIDDLTFTTSTFNLVIGMKLFGGRMMTPLRRIRG